jgi:hypothetical protein
VGHDSFLEFLDGKVPSAVPDLRVTDPGDPSFVPLSERTARQQARLLIALNAKKPRHRALFSRKEEARMNTVLPPTNLVWATED